MTHTTNIDNSRVNLAPKSQTFQERRDNLARQYLALGWQLLKVDKLQKRPRYKGWPQLGITTEEGLSNLAPYDNLGILLGPASHASNLIDLEYDDALEPNPQGKNDLLELFGGAIPTCPRMTSKKGEHHFFRFPKEFIAAFDGIDGRPDGCATFKYKAVECRIGYHKGAQTLLPPSCVEYGGEVFERKWAVFPTPDNIPTLPAEVVAKLIDAYTASFVKQSTWRPSTWDGEYKTGENWKENYRTDLRTFDLVGFCKAHNIDYRQTGQDKYDVVCPWACDHNNGRARGQELMASMLKHPVSGYWGFHCLHSHCTGKSAEDWFGYYGREVEAHCDKPFNHAVSLTDDDTERIAAMAIDYPVATQHTPDGLLDGPTEVIDVQAHLPPEYLPVGTVADDMTPQTPETNKPTVTGACEAKPKPKYNWWHIDDILLPTMPPKHLVYRHLMLGEIAWLNAKTTVGKTYYADALALSISTGIPFLGQFETKQVPVVYLGNEGANGNRYRVKAWCKTHDTTPERGMFSMLPHDICLLDAADDVIEAIEHNLTRQPGLLVVDTQSKMMGGANENDGADMARFLAGVNKIRAKYDCAVLIVSHPGHDKPDRMRGHSSQWPAAETVILLDGSINSEAGISVTIAKQKNDEPLPPYNAHAVKVPDLGVDAYGNDLSNLALKYVGEYRKPKTKREKEKEKRGDDWLSPKDRRIVDALLGLGTDPWQYSEAYKACKCDLPTNHPDYFTSEDTVGRRLKKWQTTGLITQDPITGRYMLVRAALPLDMQNALAV